METERELAEELAGVARELVAAGDVLATLQRIADLAVATIDGCDHAGISLIVQGRVDTPVQTTPPVPQMVDRLQNELEEGPCLDAIGEHRVFETGDLARESRWPEFSHAVVALTGVRSVLSMRLFVGDETLGALNLYAESVDAFDDVDRSVASIFAAHAALALRAAQREEQLTLAVETRDVIGQAKGIIMARRGVDDATAFAMLRDGSSRMNRKLREVADLVVTHEHDR